MRSIFDFGNLGSNYKNYESVSAGIHSKLNEIHEKNLEQIISVRSEKASGDIDFYVTSSEGSITVNGKVFDDTELALKYIVETIKSVHKETLNH